MKYFKFSFISVLISTLILPFDVSFSDDGAALVLQKEISDFTKYYVNHPIRDAQESAIAQFFKKQNPDSYNAEDITKNTRLNQITRERIEGLSSKIKDQNPSVYYQIIFDHLLTEYLSTQPINSDDQNSLLKLDALAKLILQISEDRELEIKKLEEDRKLDHEITTTVDHTFDIAMKVLGTLLIAKIGLKLLEKGSALAEKKMIRIPNTPSYRYYKTGLKQINESRLVSELEFKNMYSFTKLKKILIFGTGVGIGITFYNWMKDHFTRFSVKKESPRPAFQIIQAFRMLDLNLKIIALSVFLEIHAKGLDQNKVTLIQAKFQEYSALLKHFENSPSGISQSQLPIIPSEYLSTISNILKTQPDFWKTSDTKNIPEKIVEIYESELSKVDPVADLETRTEVQSYVEGKEHLEVSVNILRNQLDQMQAEYEFLRPKTTANPLPQ